MSECTLIRLHRAGSPIGELEAYDVHGSGRSNKLWSGEILLGDKLVNVEFANMRKIAEYARGYGCTVEKVKRP